MHIPEFIKTYGLIAVLILISFWVASRFIEPPPPRSFTLAAGSKQGDYYRYAERYKALLEKEGITVNIIETAGSNENIQLLQDKKADFAFIQSGLYSVDQNIEALASLYYEPLWTFTRLPSLPKKDIQNLRGKKIAIGSQGSGTRAISLELLSLNNITDESLFSDLSGSDAADALESGEVDAAFFVGRPSASTISRLLANNKLTLMSFTRAGGYTNRLPYLSEVTLREGVINLAQNIPQSDIRLLSPVAQLAVREDFNGTLKSFLVDVTTKLYKEGDIFAAKGTFPSLKYTDLPIAEEAERYFKNGPNILQRFLPFWIADTIGRMVVLLIPLVGVMFPLLKIASPAYRWRTRAKIYKWYKSLKSMEDLAGAQHDDLTEALAALERIDSEVRKTKVPLSYSDELYNLRLHIQMIKDHIKQTTVN